MAGEALEELIRAVAENEAAGVVVDLAARPSESVIDSYRAMAGADMDGHALYSLERYDPEGAAVKWEEIKQAARQELASGMRAASASLAYDSTPMDRARFLVLRESLAEEWQPRGAIELSLIEQMATAQTYLWEWTRRLTDLSARMESGERMDLAEIGKEMGEWKRMNCRALLAPRVSDAEEMEQAVGMVDRWNRLYLRVLRQLRDLRRYSGPVIVNQGGQVNVGEKQINVHPGGETGIVPDRLG